MSVYEETEFILNKYNVRANKDFGQNFLIDDYTINSIVSSANVKENDIVIEIGPGLGTLTNELLKYAYKVIAIEIDERMIHILNDRFKLYNSFKLINEDVLKVDLNEVIYRVKEEAKNNNIVVGKVKVVANLPYYISTPIITKLLENKNQIDEIIVMLQKEVADRIIAKTGTRDAGAITYTIEYYAESEKVIDVGKECFIPSPKVESAVIKLNVRKNLNIKIENEEICFKLIRDNFNQRRKTLGNILVNYKYVNSKIEAENILRNLGLESNVRGENLTLEQFARISEKI